MQISQLFNIQRRFLRSTHIERDFRDSTCLDGYIVTPHVRESIRRLNSGLAPRSGLRSWRITGDYYNTHWHQTSTTDATVSEILNSKGRISTGPVLRF